MTDDVSRDNNVAEPICVPHVKGSHAARDCTKTTGAGAVCAPL